MHKQIKTLSIYLGLAAIVLVWWTLAFHPGKMNQDLSIFLSKGSTKIGPNFPPTTLSAIDRESLKKALAGDFALMSKLIIDWDFDAQILQQANFEGFSRLPQNELLRCQLLCRQLQEKQTPEPHPSSIIDDAGNKISLNTPYQKFLPQTYMSASFLLALLPPGNIVALPRHLREQEQIHPKTLTNQIPLDIDRYNSEKLFQSQPDIAFVASYSHPATIQALTNQGIQTYFSKSPSTLEDISQELLNIGLIVNRPLEAEMLKTFMDATYIALDNQLQLHRLMKDSNKQNISLLYLYYHHNFSIPTKKTLTGQLLSRLHTTNITLLHKKETDDGNNWTNPINKENILSLNPQWIIIATENPSTLKQEIQKDPAMQQMAALRHQKIAFVDESIQQSASQYIVLAYYDIIHALINLL